MTVTLTEDMKNMIAAQLSFIATVDEAGHPQIGPKGTLRVLDDTHLIYNEHTGKQAWHNVEANHKVVVATVNHAAFKGYRFEGLAEVHQADAIYEEAVTFAAGHHVPKPVAAVVIDLERIYKLDAGPNAGDLLEGTAY